MKKNHKKISKSLRKRKELVFVSVFVVVGAALLLGTRAAISSLNFEPENSNHSGNRVIGSDFSASEGKYIRFGDGVGSPGPYPPPSTESQKGTFGVRCDFSHTAQVDPIVNPGPSGTPSGHLHDFFGNMTTDSDSTLETLLAGDTNCRVTGDTATYWTPSLIDPNGNRVKPIWNFIYYRNIPINYGTVHAFPVDFRMVGDPEGDPKFAWWHCNNDPSTTRYNSPPNCGGERVRMKLLFPNCWDGINLDSPDHKSHVLYHNGNNSRSCPESHPIKLPQLYFTVSFPVGSGGPGYRLSDGKLTPHGDFINSWQPDAYAELHERCTEAEVNCGQIR